MNMSPNLTNINWYIELIGDISPQDILKDLEDGRHDRIILEALEGRIGLSKWPPPGEWKYILYEDTCICYGRPRNERDSEPRED